MPKYLIEVKEKQIVEGQPSYVTSSHVIDAASAAQARVFFVQRKFPNEVIQSVTLQEEVVKKKNTSRYRE